MKLYMVRDKTTGKFVSNLTNPRHKYWESRKRAESAIKNYNPKRFCLRNHEIEEENYDLEIVEFDLVESVAK